MTLQRLIIITALLLCASTVFAQGMSNQMDEMFNGMSTYTRPGHYESQTRGVITGGGFSYRAQQAQTQSLFALSPPTLSAGCGGVDLYMGSFSSISEDEITDLAKAIASQAAGYAFEVALSSICPTCAATMDKLRAWMNQINGGLKGSCETARMLVNPSTTNGQWEFMKWDALDSAAASAGQWMDNYDDTLDARRNQDKFAEDAPPEVKYNNPLYNAMTKQNVASWFGHGGLNGNEFGMDMLSLFGMVTFCTPHPTTPECQQFDENETFRETDLAPTLDLAHLVYGSDSVMSPAIMGEVYRCDSHLCLNPYKQNYQDEGLAKRIVDAFLGTDGSPGIIAKLQDANASPFTDEERGVVEATADMTAIARNLAMTSHDRARGFVESWAAVMATEIAYGFAREAYRGLVSALRMTPGLGNEIALLRLQRRMDELDIERNRLVSLSTITTSGMMEHYDLMRSTIVENSRLYQATPTSFLDSRNNAGTP